MNIVIIDGNPDANDTEYENYLDSLARHLMDSKHIVKRMRLREMKIKYCIGCWSCWVKTPGRCFVSDDSHEVCREYIHVDFVLFSSPVIMGFTSALLKRAQDKLIPLLHPYIVIDQNESHHRKRYDSYPGIGLLLKPSRDTDREDIEIINDIYHRFALNFKSTLSFSKNMNDNIEEVANAINSL